MSSTDTAAAEWWRWPFDTTGFPDRWHCGTAWGEEPWVGWMHIVSDVAIWLAYMSIPIALAYFMYRKRDVTFYRIMWLFCAFIAACGSGHLIEAVIFWQPVYRLAAVVKVFTAVVSLATVVALLKITPLALKLPGLAQMNRELRKEAEERRLAQEQYAELNRSLEATVAERTAESERRAAALIEKNDELKSEIDKRAHLQERLIEASRYAGMAEVATDVLHNVGNVLNSVNVSARLLLEQVRASRVNSLIAASRVVDGHRDDLAAYLTEDTKGRHFPDLFNELTKTIAGERDSQLEELNSLVNNIEHVNVIVDMQQRHAQFSGVTELINPVDLFENAISIKQTSLREHSIEVIRRFDDVPSIITERHKALQILVNLIRNARESLDGSNWQPKTVTLDVAHDDETVRFAVRDNGMGIAPDDLKTIFKQGRTAGHGLGLHSSALAAQELGGSLSAHSDGLGKGAAFTLRLPIEVNSLCKV